MQGRPPRDARTITYDAQGQELALRFPYDDALREAIKAIPGARWAREAGRCWFVPARHAAEVLEVLAQHPPPFAVPDEVLQLAARGGRNARMRRLRQAETTKSLTPLSLGEQLRQLTRDAFPHDLWIIGQIEGWKDRGWFDLVEHYPDERRPRALLHAFINERVYHHAARQLASMTPSFAWQDRLDVRLRARPAFHPRTGRLQLDVLEIDPFYTVTLLNERRVEALRRLDEAGISEQNLALPLPEVPLRVALLTRQGSDAEADFLAVLRRSGLGFQVTGYDVRVQGEALERTVLRALDHAARRADRYDVVVITRGGGGGLDLAGFDLEAVGRAVCLHPLPVIAGIGHHKDHSLVDDVACRSLQTPTEAAHFLVEQVQAFLEDLEALQRRIAEVAGGGVAAARAELQGVVQGIRREARHHLRAARRDVEDVASDVGRAAGVRLRGERERLGELGRALPQRWRQRARREERELGWLEGALSPQRRLQRLGEQRAALEALRARLARACRARLRAERGGLENLQVRREAADPERVLARGFAAVTRVSGALVRDAGQIEAGEVVEVRLARGRLRAARLDER